MNKEELKDKNKFLFEDGTESEFLNYFTSIFPRFLAHCYNVVEKEARDLLAVYFHDDASAQTPTVAIDTPGIELKGSKLTINCFDVITFPETIVNLHTLKIFGISNLFMEKKKLFTKFLTRNGSNVTQLELNESSLTFDSVNKVMQKLPNLKTAKYDRVELNVQKTKPTLILEVLDRDGSINIKLLKKITIACLRELKERHSKNKCKCKTEQ